MAPTLRLAAVVIALAGSAAARKPPRPEPVSLTDEERAAYRKVMVAAAGALPTVADFDKRVVAIDVPSVGTLVDPSDKKGRPFPDGAAVEVHYTDENSAAVVTMRAVGRYDAGYERAMRREDRTKLDAAFAICDATDVKKWRGSPPVRCFEVEIKGERAPRVDAKLDVNTIKAVLDADRKRATEK